MELPAELQQRLAAALAEMRADPAHQLRPYRRQEIYAALGPAADPATKLTLGWVNLFAARAVLPLWESIAAAIARDLRENYGYSEAQIEQEDLGLPQKALNAVEAMVTEGEDESNFDSLLDIFYNWFHIALSPWFSRRAWWAIKAIYIAAYFNGFGYFDPGRASFTKDPTIRDFDLRDSELDAAGLALLAWAAILESPRRWRLGMDWDKSLMFWEWWLQEAVPRAWELAHPPR